MFYVRILNNGEAVGPIEGSGNTEAKTNATGTVVSTINLNVRKGPGVEFDAVGSLKPGSKVTIYEQTMKGGMSWGRIANGWISLAYVTMDSTGNTGKGEMGTIARCFRAVNVRSAPGTGNALVGTIAVNSRVEILQQVNYNGKMWGKVQNGWISMDYVLLDSELPNPPIPDGEGAKPNEKPNKPTNPTTPEDSDAVAFSIGCNVDISTGLKIRKTATSATDNIVGELKNGQFAQIKGLKQVGSKLWGRVEGGWIDLTFVTFNSEAIVRQKDLPARKAPSSYSDKTRTLKKDDAINIVGIALEGKNVWGKLAKGDWIDMSGAEIGGKPGEPVNDNPAVALSGYGVTHTNAIARKDAVAASAEVFTFPGVGTIQFMALKADMENDKLYWAKIEADGKPCWISLDDVDISMPAVVNANMTKANQEPGKASITARVYNRNEKVTVTDLAIADGEIWGKVGSYWVRYANLDVDGTPDKHINSNPEVDFFAPLKAQKVLGMYTDASTKCDYVTGLPAGPFETLALKNDDEVEGQLWAKVMVGGVPAWVVISSSVSYGFDAMVTVPSANVYEQADTASNAVEVLAQNKVVTIGNLKLVDTVVWGNITSGWVRMSDLTIGAEPPKAMNPNPEYFQTMVATVCSAGANAYVEAHLDSVTDATLAAKTAVEVGSVKADANDPAKLWAKVNVKGVPRWVQMSKLSFNMDVIVKDESVDVYSEAEAKIKVAKAWHNETFKITEVALANGKVMGKNTDGWLDLAAVNLGTTKMPWANNNTEYPFAATFSIMVNTITYETATRLGLPVGSVNAGGTYTSEAVKVGDGDVFVRIVDELGNRSWFNLSQAGISMSATAKKGATLLADSNVKADKVADLTEGQALTISGIRLIGSKIWIKATAGTITGWQMLDKVNY